MLLGKVMAYVLFLCLVESVCVCVWGNIKTQSQLIQIDPQNLIIQLTLQKLLLCPQINIYPFDFVQNTPEYVSRYSSCYNNKTRKCNKTKKLCFVHYLFRSASSNYEGNLISFSLLLFVRSWGKFTVSFRRGFRKWCPLRVALTLSKWSLGWHQFGFLYCLANIIILVSSPPRFPAEQARGA